MDAALNAAPLRPPQADRTAPGLLLALAAHAVLIGLVVVNVDFHHNVTVTSAEAELWSAVPQAAAPKAVEPPPQPEPPPVKPAPEPTPTPDPAELRRDADIAVAQQKERERERREREQAAEKVAEQKRELQRQRLAEEAAERKRQQAAAKLAKPPPPEKTRTARTEPPPPPVDDRLRQEQLRRIQGLAGATGDATATGTAQRSAGFSASYAGRIAGRIKPNVVFPDALPGNPAVEVELGLSSDGRIVSRRVTKASGAPDWDQAVLRAIDKTEKLPPDTDGRVPPIITLIYHPKDLGG